MMPNAQAEVRLTRAQRTVAGLRSSSESRQVLDIAEFSADGSIGQVQRDFELLADILKRCPREAAEIVDCVLAGKMSSAHELASKIRMTEKEFQSKGGGLPWIIWAIAIGVLFMEHD